MLYNSKIADWHLRYLDMYQNALGFLEVFCYKMVTALDVWLLTD
jgi:hypothetical protein